MNIGEIRQKIYWDVLVLMLIGTLWIEGELFFVISAIYYFGLVLKKRGKFWVPKVAGLRWYLISILLCTIVGLIQYPFRNVMRDLYYVLPTVLWIFIIYHLGKKNTNNIKQIWETIYLYGGLVSVKSIITFLVQILVNPILEFDALREIFGIGVYEVGFVLPIMIMDVFVLRKTIFSTILDRVIISCMVVQIALSFGRVALIQPIVEVFILMILIVGIHKETSRLVKRIVVVFGIFLVFGVIVFTVMPREITEIFMGKFMGSFAEIDSKQQITSVETAMENWRAYEIQAAWKQWGDSNVFVKIFGAGIGKGVHIDYIPHNWEGIVMDNEIPLLHNGFCSLIPKGGLVMMFGLCLVFWGNIIKGFRLIKCNGIYNNGGLILVAVSVAAIVNTYVVRGPVQQGIFLMWAVIVGWVNCPRDNEDKQSELSIF